MTDRAETWISETLYPAFQQRFEASRILFRSQTDLQDLAIFENPYFGRILVLDGAIQTTTRDEACYHEMLVHVPVFAHGNAKNVLIVGGGDGGALRDVLKHRSVERATMVEIDGSVVEMCREYLPSLSDGAFDDPRAEVVIADGVRYVRETDRRFDVIIVDSTDPVGPAVPLFSDDFYRDCRAALTDDGIVDAALYLTQVPTYAFGFMTLGWGARSGHARATDAATLRRRFADAGIETLYYTPDIHAASFSLPAYLERALLTE